MSKKHTNENWKENQEYYEEDNFPDLIMLPMTTLYDEIIAAIHRQDIFFIKRCIANKVNINQFDNLFDDTVLMAALRAGNKDMCYCLIEAGADVDGCCLDAGDSVLSCAIDAGFVDIVRLCLEKSSDSDIANDCDHYGFTALMRAVENPEIVKLLLEAGADINEKICERDIYEEDFHDDTALMIAAMKGAKESLILLINAGADIHELNDSGQNLLMQAAKSGNIDLVEYLLNLGFDIRAKDHDGKTAEDHALEHDHRPIAQYLQTMLDLQDSGY